MVNPVIPESVTPEQACFSDDSESNRMFWGYYRMHLSADHTRIDVEPVRNVSMHLNALSVMEAYDPNSVSLGEAYVDPDDGTITVEITLTHPLPDFTKYTAFDVRGIVMLPAQVEYPTLGLTSPGTIPGQAALLNADGYTRRWNPTEFSGQPKMFHYFDGILLPPGLGSKADALVNPFRTFISNPQRNYFEAGASLSKHYHLSFPPGPMIFGYAVDGSWEPHNITDTFFTQFAEDDVDKNNWKAKNQDGGISDFWQCGWFEDSVNVKDEFCESFGAPEDAAILYSPKFDVPADTSDITLELKHIISFDEDNELGGEMCTVFITPDQSVDTAVQLTASNHPYDFLDDPVCGFDWWLTDHTQPKPDKFDLSGVLSLFEGENYWIAFAFVTLNGDDGTNNGGWTLNQMRIINANAPPENIPGSFPLKANSIEPYSVQLIETSGNLECSLGEYAGGSINLKVEVKDWQLGASVPFSGVSLEAPDLFTGIVHPWTGGGNQSTYTYEIIVENDLMAHPGEYPALFAISVPDDDPNYLPTDPLAAYMMFNLEVNEIDPPFCLTQDGIHNTYSGAFQLIGAIPNLHIDCDFMPIIAGGAGGLLFDGGISGNNEMIKVAAIDADGGDVPATTIIQKSGTEAGNALVLQSNEYNGHILVVTDNDRDNLLVYNAAGELLKDSIDLGIGEDSINEPVCLTANPNNGDIWIVGHKGNDGIHLERWAYIEQGDLFDYVKDPASKIDLDPFLGPDPKPLGIEINGKYNYLYLFHARYFGTVDIFDLSSTPPVKNTDWSRSNIFSETLALTGVPGLRKLIGGDILIDHTGGENDARCRILLFANTQSGASQLVKMDTWCQILNSVSLGSPYACAAINNLSSVNDRSLVLFPMYPSTAYSLFLPPDNW